MVFVWNTTPTHLKFDLRSVKCVLLGYSAYRCLNPITNKLYVSVDVSFFESVPYFPITASCEWKLDFLDIVIYPTPIDIFPTTISKEPSLSLDPPPLRQPESPPIICIYTRHTRYDVPTLKLANSLQELESTTGFIPITNHIPDGKIVTFIHY
ncbi:uncharacterized protein LOC110037147 [Phalaenopsis equestris]|uniref:uncharacterized protein LOC110037147 n=1 Tax=Phalaenopsis equestris TaxID=78828 RepID=UPI0009E2C09E|nr:uncharacterized protein LOC110037147 [Phalaenopsis equestris]